MLFNQLLPQQNSLNGLTGMLGGGPMPGMQMPSGMMPGAAGSSPGSLAGLIASATAGGGGGMNVAPQLPGKPGAAPQSAPNQSPIPAAPQPQPQMGMQDPSRDMEKLKAFLTSLGLGTQSGGGAPTAQPMNLFGSLGNFFSSLFPTG